MNYLFNHKKDRSRYGDELFKHNFPIHKKATSSTLIDLRDKDVARFDQGPLGSCTANAGGGIWGFTELKAIAEGILLAPEEFQGAYGGYKNISRLMLYFLARCLAGDVATDGGAELKDIVGVFARWGVCQEAMWPYDISKVFQSPPRECYGSAWHHRVTKSFRITDGNAEEINTCLLQGYPVIFGVEVYENFMSDGVTYSGIVQMPKGADLGGHAMEIVGLDGDWYIVRNSYGEDWGDRGYCFMPSSYILDPALTSDFWTIRL